jgi:phytepsin
VTEINLAIGATGIVSNECKLIVQEYGDQIIEMLLEQVEMSADLHFGMELSDVDI